MPNAPAVTCDLVYRDPYVCQPFLFTPFRHCLFKTVHITLLYVHTNCGHYYGLPPRRNASFRDTQLKIKTSFFFGMSHRRPPVDFAFWLAIVELGVNHVFHLEVCSDPKMVELCGKDVRKNQVKGKMNNELFLTLLFKRFLRVLTLRQNFCNSAFVSRSLGIKVWV